MRLARNTAGQLQSSVVVSVISRPRVDELVKTTTAEGEDTASLTCRVSKNPVPRIAWRKWSSSDKLVSGPQPGDCRILVEDMEVDAPEYTEGERVWVQSTLTIQGINRSDDGLYESEGSRETKVGHLLVEYRPTFSSKPEKAWS